MSTNPVAVPETQPTRRPETGAVGRMTGVIVNPKSTFAEIARRPTWVVPFITLCVLSIIVSGLLAQKTDWRSFFERQMSKNSRLDQMPQEQKDRIIENQVKYAPKFAFAFGVIFTAVFVLLMRWRPSSALLSCGERSSLLRRPSAHGIPPNASWWLR